MKKLGLVCRIRKAKDKRSKNVAVTFQNIASRDYDGYIMISMLLMLHTTFANRCWSKFCIYVAVIHHKTKKF